MEKTRRLGSARLSEVFGKKALNIDRFSISIGYRNVSQVYWDSNKIDDYTRKLLQSYSDGVNDFI